MYGERIRQLRKGRKMTLRELSNELGIPFTTLGNYEREDRQPNLETFQAIANYFDVPVDFLLRKEDFDQYLIKEGVQTIEEQLNKATPATRKIALKTYDRLNSITREELESGDLKILTLLSEIVDFIFDIKDEFKFIHDLPTLPKELTVGSISNPYDMATKFIKEKNRIDNCFNEIFEEYARRNGF